MIRISVLIYFILLSRAVRVGVVFVYMLELIYIHTLSLFLNLMIQPKEASSVCLLLHYHFLQFYWGFLTLVVPKKTYRASTLLQAEETAIPSQISCSKPGPL
jgi:hypothetical protein